MRVIYYIKTKKSLRRDFFAMKNPNRGEDLLKTPLSRKCWKIKRNQH